MQDVSARQGGAAGSRQGTTLVVGYGFIGSRVVRALIENGETPTVLTRSELDQNTTPSLHGLRLQVGDAARKQDLEGALEGVGRVVYAAGGLLPAASEREPERDAELTLGPLRSVLGALRDRPGVSLVYLSSGGTVYGDPERIPVGEDEPTRPRGVYGELHVRCEQEVLRDVHEHGLRARILRCSTVYGEGQKPDRGQGVINTFISHIQRGTPIELFGDGATVRDYLYVGDLARIIVNLLPLAAGPTTLNVGSGEGTSLEEIVRLTEAVVGRSAHIVRHPERPFDVHQIVLDIKRLRELVTPPATPLEVGVRLTHEWLAALESEAA